MMPTPQSKTQINQYPLDLANPVQEIDLALLGFEELVRHGKQMGVNFLQQLVPLGPSPPVPAPRILQPYAAACRFLQELLDKQLILPELPNRHRFGQTLALTLNLVQKTVQLLMTGPLILLAQVVREAFLFDAVGRRIIRPNPFIAERAPARIDLHIAYTDLSLTGGKWLNNVRNVQPA